MGHTLWYPGPFVCFSVPIATGRLTEAAWRRMQHSAGMRSQVGEFWYKLSLKATQPAPTVISGLVCEIGKRVEVRCVALATVCCERE